MLDRYDIGIDHYDWDASRLDITIEDDGDWRKHSDVAALVAENGQLRADAREMAQRMLAARKREEETK